MIERCTEASGPGSMEAWVTLRPEDEGCEAFYEAVARAVAGRGAVVLAERCVARREAFGEIEAARAAAFARAGIDGAGALALVGQTPCRGGDVAGAQLWLALGPSRAGVTALVVDGQVVGRRYRTPTHTAWWLPRVDPRPEATGRYEQAVSMLQEVGRLLGAAGLAWRHVARTWITVPSLLEWYPTLNRARRQVFGEAGLLSPGAPVAWLPASTGIQGASPSGRECAVSVLAVSPEPGGEAALRRVGSPGQCEALDYGSAFSRAVEHVYGGASRLYVSGTASIGPGGESLHDGDAEAQSRETLAVVRELLVARGHSLADIAEATVFLKRPEDAAAFRTVAAEAGMDLGVVVEAVADVCRDELLVELEILSVARVDGQRDAPR